MPWVANLGEAQVTPRIPLHCLTRYLDRPYPLPATNIFYYHIP